MMDNSDDSMTLGEEAHLEQMMYSILDDDLYFSDNARLGYWQTKDGQRLKITEMGLGHLQNALRMLEPKSGVVVMVKGHLRDTMSYITQFKEEIYRREHPLEGLVR